MAGVAIILVVAATAGLAFALALFQGTIGNSVFEWGQVKEFTGVFVSTPYPHLRVIRPGLTSTNKVHSSYLLVAPFKFGIDPDKAKHFDGKSVDLRGTLIYRGNQTMIEMVEDSMELRNGPSGTSATATIESLGTQTLRGEIVDSKCYFGVMNPGQFIPHRACAIRCISGGIPPILVVRREIGPPQHFLLVASDGLPVNKQVLDLVAEPTEITGQVERQGDLLILRAEPSTYRRL